MSSPGDGGGQQFTPNEEYVNSLMNTLAISRSVAVRALYETDNNVEMAGSWVLENQGPDEEDSSEEETELEGFLDQGDFYKMVFVVNSELNMGVGKIAVQVAHAALALFKMLSGNQKQYGEMLLQWEQFGETKIVLKGTNSQQLMVIAGKAASLGLTQYLVHDAGKTEVPAGANTVVGVMGKADMVDQVTGDLPLL